MTELTVTGILFSPLIPWGWWSAMALAAAMLLGFGVWAQARGVAFRALFAAAALAALANPTLVRETRSTLPDVAALVIDQSASTKLQDRAAAAEAAAAEIKAKLERIENLEFRIVRVGDGAGGPDGGTALIGALDRALADVPPSRQAGAILITDGQVHDANAAGARGKAAGPMHVLLLGQPNERDRRLVIENAPSFGIVGQPLALRMRIDDPAAAGSTVEVTLKPAGQEAVRRPLIVGQSQLIEMPLKRAGVNAIEIDVGEGESELTLANNRALIEVNGVRERLRVLLISGRPHPGERVWRNLLKSDPSVDLVHFTILRPPEKQDGTPVRELALIAFPVQELFERKLASFDLVIFDQYQSQGILPPEYFERLVKYVREGGAILEASGPTFATDLSIYQTALGQVLPGRPTGREFRGGFRPTLTAAGNRHPVTEDLPGSPAANAGQAPEAPASEPGASQPPANKPWGRWLRMVDVSPTFGDVVMAGSGDLPLLLLARVQEGRVAQMTSDQAWLWARGFDGGGPQAELLRRLVHWLMREPDLEENDLRARAKGSRIEISSRRLAPDDAPVTLTAPDGATSEIALSPFSGGESRASVEAPALGLYRISDGKAEALALVGGQNSKEFADVRASAEALAPLARASGGGVQWLVRDGVPDIRRVGPGRTAFGRGWIGLEEKNDFRILGLAQQSLLPALALLALTLSALLLAWWREGR